MLGRGNQFTVDNEMATPDLRGLCSALSEDLFTRCAGSRGTCSGSKDHVYSLASL